MRRCLILANQTLGGPHLIQAVLARQAREPYEFHIVVPATRCGGNRLTRSLSRPCRRARRVG